MEENKSGEEHKTDKKHAIEHSAGHQQHKKEKIITKPIIVLLAIASLLIIYNQFQIMGVYASLSGSFGSGASSFVTGANDLRWIFVGPSTSTIVFKYETLEFRI